MEKKEKNQRKITVFLLLAVAFIAVFVGIGIYNAPVNQLQRQVDSGNRYLEEERYEEATIAFEQAIATDARCMEAYAGGMEAYQHMGDAESLRVLYDRAVDAAGELDADMAAENIDAG